MRLLVTLTSLLTEAFAFLPTIYTNILILLTKPVSFRLNFEDGSSKRNDRRPHILRRKDYKTYTSIKYENGIRTASMSGGTLILIDIELIKAVNQTDFNKFPDRHPPFYHSDPSMNKMLSFATGEEWKRLKVILTKAFSTSRIRRVYQSLDETAIKLVEFIRSDLEVMEGSEMEIVGPVNKYLLELIATSVFGLEDTGILTSKQESPFEVYTKEVQRAMVRHRQARLIPWALKLANMFNLIRPDPRAVAFFKAILVDSINRRREKGESGDDMLQLLMESTSAKDNDGLTDDTILSQAFMFFFAGTEGPATLLIYGLYELAMNPNVQQRLYEEIDAVSKGTTEHLDPDTLSKLPYLDMFVCEVLRMYSSSVTARRCSKAYKVPKTDIILQPGTNVHTPIYGIHHDSEYYRDPFTFNPEHFNADAKAARPPAAYMPFGIGPRSCIATKFGLVQGKSAIYHMVYNFKVEACWRTETPPEGTVKSMFLPVNGLWLRFKDRRLQDSEV